MRLLASKKRKIALGTVLFVIVLGIGASLLSKWANAPSQQTIDAPSSQIPTAQLAYKTVQTPYFSTWVPKDWRVESQVDTASPNRWHLVAYGSAGSSQAAITSDLLPAGQLTGVADYHLRASSPASYTKFSDPSFPTGSQTFRAVSGTPEYTIFLTHGNRYASVTASGPTTPAALLGLLKTLVVQWVWV